MSSQPLPLTPSVVASNTLPPPDIRTMAMNAAAFSPTGELLHPELLSDNEKTVLALLGNEVQVEQVPLDRTNQIQGNTTSEIPQQEVPRTSEQIARPELQKQISKIERELTERHVPLDEVDIEKELRARSILVSLGAPMPPIDISYEEADELKPSFEGDIGPSFWDGYMKLKEMNKVSITVEQMRDHFMKYERQEPRDISLDRFIKHEQYDFDKQAFAEVQEIGFVPWLQASVYRRIDKRFSKGIEHLESSAIAEASKLVKETVSTGPDQNIRIIYAQQNQHGRWIDYKGGELTPQEIKIRSALIKDMRHDLPLFQSKAAYEITKVEAAQQAELWQRIVNIQLYELGYHPQEVNLVMIGLQYINKPLYLNFKHRKFVNPLIRGEDGEIILKYKLDEEGRALKFVPKKEGKGKKQRFIYVDSFQRIPVGEYVEVPDHELTGTNGAFIESQDIDENGVTRTNRTLRREGFVDTSRVVWSPLDLRGYATEIATRFSSYDMRFEASDVAGLDHTFERVIADLDSQFYNPEARSTNEKYLTALYFIGMLKSVVDKSTMGPASDMTKAEGADLAREMDLLNRGVAYEPSLPASSAEADRIWKLFARRLNVVVRRHPASMKKNDHREYRGKVSPIEPKKPDITYLSS